MLLRIIFLIVLISMEIKSTKSERKIMQGKNVKTEQGFAVYIVNGPETSKYYYRWLCGGAIVSPWFVVTSAACVEDLDYMYVISGYRTNIQYYDPYKQDTCTRDFKKKIVYTCVPKVYNLNYAKVEEWSLVDIAVVKVDIAFNFMDKKYLKSCHYLPRPIEINYDPDFQLPNTDAIVLGWGHNSIWRKVDETPLKDHNKKELQYSSVKIHNNDECKRHFPKALENVIDKYMICTLHGGHLNEKGERVLKLRKPLADGCTPVLSLDSEGEIECEEDEYLNDFRRRSKNLSGLIERLQNSSRRQGICQNDHGGPLVTWKGRRQILIGVASVFRVTNESRCTGPFLYTSTQRNKNFLYCAINGTGTRSTVCDQPPREKGFDVVQRHLSWENHPDE